MARWRQWPACRLVGIGIAALAASAPAVASAAAPHVSHVSCYASCTSSGKVVPDGRVQLFGKHFASGMRVVFPVRTTDGAVSSRSAKTRLTKRHTLIARVPSDGRSGGIFVQVPDGPRSNVVHLGISSARPSDPRPPGPSPFDHNAMWIWYVSHASGGSPDAIVRKARDHGIGTVFVKSGDGSNYWSQFSSRVVKELKAGGLGVCAWQYVYGDHPKDEAKVAARAIAAGADCFVIDAEVEYEGRYTQAAKYVSHLRSAAGTNFPIALAGFPYVDYHPAFPYSVFLGPGGAQFNLPQAYWRDIGSTVGSVLGHTYTWNRPYGRTLAPVGQLYDDPPRSEILHFRKYAAAEGSSGVSWWSWQHATATGWHAVGDRLDDFHGHVAKGDASIAKGARGDIVLWAQQHLRGAGEDLSLDGDFGSQTRSAVRDFQSRSGLPVTGVIDDDTWTALLRYEPLRKARAGAGGGVVITPKSARLPAKRYEIPPARERGP